MFLRDLDSLQTDETGKDIFVHVTALNGLELNDGDKVVCTEEASRKGIVAMPN